MIFSILKLCQNCLELPALHICTSCQCQQHVEIFVRLTELYMNQRASESVLMIFFHSTRGTVCLTSLGWVLRLSWRGIDWVKMNSILVGFIINCNKRTLRLEKLRNSWVNWQMRLIQPSKDPPGGLRWLQETKGSSQMKLEAQLGSRISVNSRVPVQLWSGLVDLWITGTYNLQCNHQI